MKKKSLNKKSIIHNASERIAAGALGYGVVSMLFGIIWQHRWPLDSLIALFIFLSMFPVWEITKQQNINQ